MSATEAVAAVAPSTGVPSTGERYAPVGDLELCYEAFGDPADPTVLLIMGLGTQMLAWEEGFCGLLAERGFHVVRFDNRDVGLSTHLSGAVTPSLTDMALRRKGAAAYALSDLAVDAVGLLDHLGVERAHVVGASMGGMIAQLIAARRPERTRSLVSIMSTTGSPWIGQPAFSSYRFFLSPPASGEEEAVERSVALFTHVGSTTYARDEALMRASASRAFRRAYDPAGSGRQLQAIQTAPDRTRELATITAPTLVVHGTVDKLVRPSGGRATARAIPGARLDLVEGMGHDLPEGVWPRIVDGIVATAARAR